MGRRRGVCGKVMFATPVEAVFAVRRLRDQNVPVKGVYFCVKCASYHITKQDGVTRLNETPPAILTPPNGGSQ